MANEPVDLFESEDFWEQNKGKIIGYTVVILLAIGGWGVYEYQRQSRIAAAEQAYAVADTTEEYGKVAEEFKGTTPAGNATLVLAAKLREEKKLDEAVTLLRTFIAGEPKYPLLAEAWLSLAVTLELQEKPDEATTVYQEIVTKFPQSSTAPAALAAQARLLVAKNDIVAAERIYQDLTVRYPESLQAREAQRELRLLKQYAPEAAKAAPATPAAEATPATPAPSATPAE